MAATLPPSPPPPAARPRRRALAEEIRDQIAADFIFSGAIPAGERLPGEHPLSERYGVSRVTIRAALHSLRDAGLIQTRQGLGAIVVEQTPQLVQGLDVLCSLESFAREANAEIGTADLEFEELTADATIAERLDVPEGEPVLAIRRVKLLGGVRAGYSVDYVPAGALPFETLRGEHAGSTLDVFLAHGEPQVDHADTELAPIRLPREVAQRLGVRTGTSGLLLDMVVKTAEGRTVAWSAAWLLPDHFRFVLRRRLPIGR